MVIVVIIMWHKVSQNIFNKQHHDSLKTANFSGVFNKASMDKVKLKTDLKKLIYNNNSNNFENNVNAAMNSVATNSSIIILSIIVLPSF